MINTTYIFLFKKKKKWKYKNVSKWTRSIRFTCDDMINVRDIGELNDYLMIGKCTRALVHNTCLNKNDAVSVHTYTLYRKTHRHSPKKKNTKHWHEKDRKVEKKRTTGVHVEEVYVFCVKWNNWWNNENKKEKRNMTATKKMTQRSNLNEWQGK